MKWSTAFMVVGSDVWIESKQRDAEQLELIEEAE